ncbi:hypothetical protein BCV69DRAFT_151736 [Microstroma glucosiphilum]|uniref:Uncharacterized protein n=1 Tax=Pseudomicrostroma glucosiphilum TaxID=1684307 RepID=A0A316U3Z8_9BASI|nr:hypothetical protein BCV69DRAFT_151736 [Pseudomicrostroma glucosiphilum]PWN17635.1 hypothetical protein BCV69DRAFT_151736 [Pseudomicrostroma glucosiphilum]
MLLLKSITEDPDRSMVLRKDPTCIHFHCAYGFATQRLADMLDSSVHNFTYCLTLFPKCFSSFPHGTCSLSVSPQYLALDGIYHPF